MIGGPTDNGPGKPGWYDLSTVVKGRLRPFIRCEHNADWCGDILSVAWGTRWHANRLLSNVGSEGTAEFNGIHIVTLRTPTRISGRSFFGVLRIWSGRPMARNSCSTRRDRSTS